MPQTPLPELRTLQQAVDGLLYPSESDTPFDVIHWPAGGAASAQEAVVAHEKAGRKIEEMPVADFFEQVNGSEDAKRFADLRKRLESQLKGLKIFRVGSGETRVDIYLIGKAAAGDWIGLHTVSVET